MYFTWRRDIAAGRATYTPLSLYTAIFSFWSMLFVFQVLFFISVPEKPYIFRQQTLLVRGQLSPVLPMKPPCLSRSNKCIPLYKPLRLGQSLSAFVYSHTHPLIVTIEPGKVRGTRNYIVHSDAASQRWFFDDFFFFYVSFKT